MLVASTFLLSACEQEGVVKVDDCREMIKVGSGELKKTTSTFTCTYQKNINNQIIGGICASVDMNAGKCQTAYIYERTSDISCQLNTHPSKTS